MIHEVVKVQLNLYSHREADNKIIEGLDLKTVQNHNNHIKELLHKLATSDTISLSHSEHEENLKSQIKHLQEDLLKLEIENNALKEMYKDSFENVSIQIRPTSTFNTNNALQKDNEEKKLNKQLLSSVKNLNV